MNGVGITLVNAVSDYFSVTSIRDGYQYSMEFSKGKKVKDFKKEKQKIYKHLNHGTIVSFRPDPDIIKEFAMIDINTLKENLELRSYSNAGLKINLTYGKEKTTYHNPEGIIDYMKVLNKNPISDFYKYSATSDKGDEFEVVFSYSQNSDEVIKSFVNGIATSKGTHETGFKMGLTNAFNKFINDDKLLPKNMKSGDITGEDIRSGLICIINTRVQEALYSGQTKDELSNSDIQGFMTTLTNKEVTAYIGGNKTQFKQIANRIIQFSKGRISANKYKDKISKVDSGSLNMSMSTKFTDCNSNKVEERELLIVEGDSASASVRGGRNPETQAMYSLRGKILNVYGKSNATILANKELSELTKIIFNTNDLRNIDFTKSNFSKIIFLSDSDQDGFHINSLLAEFFFEKFRGLYDLGYVYVSLPPRYRFSEGKDKFVYIQNEKELIDFQYSKISKNISIESNNLKLKNLIKIKQSYETKFNNIKNAYSISSELINKLAYPLLVEDIEEIISEMNGLKIDSNDNIVGFYNGYWHDVNIDMLLDSIETQLEPIYKNNELISFKDIKENEIYEGYLIDLYEYINSKFKFEFDYFKGLGESDASELKETTLNVNNRNLIQLKLGDIEKAMDVSKDFYGSSDKDFEKRRQIMNEYFKNILK